MFYLLIAIACSSGLNFLFKLAERNPDNNRFAVSFVNQSASFLLSLLFSLGCPLFQPGWFPSLFRELPSVLSGNSAFSAEASFGFAALLAIGAGILQFAAIFVLQTSTARNGSAVTVTFNKAGLIIPVLLSMVFFQEMPSLLQSTGILLSVLSIVLIYLNKESLGVVTSMTFLFGTMIFGGLCDFVSKVYEYYGSKPGENLFLMYLYLFSAIIALFVMMKNNRKITTRELGYGAASGVVIQLGAKFLLKALGALPAFVVLPIFSVGTILTVNLVTILLFKEKLTVRQYLAIFLMVIACIVLNL